jgi:hypothetical protein
MDELQVPLPPRPFDPERELPLPESAGHEDMQDQVQHYVRRVEAHVRERPLTSIAIAAGAGFLLARVLRD